MAVIFILIAIAELLGTYSTILALFSPFVNQEILMGYQVTFVKGLASLRNTTQDHFR